MYWLYTLAPIHQNNIDILWRPVVTSFIAPSQWLVQGGEEEDCYLSLLHGQRLRSVAESPNSAGGGEWPDLLALRPEDGLFSLNLAAKMHKTCVCYPDLPPNS